MNLYLFDQVLATAMGEGDGGMNSYLLEKGIDGGMNSYLWGRGSRRHIEGTSIIARI